MASVQDRLKLKRVPLDNWSISEQLYLASAVACSGDQNWMSVSRALKMSCGGDRPSDWFSQKSCAAQYGKLLENVETPKRKKRNEKDTSQTTVDTPSELILRKLTHERMSELKKLIHDDRQEYLQCKEEIASIETGAVDELQLMEMWKQIEEEEMQREKNQQKHAEWLKDREERKKELERSWRPNAFLYQQNSPNQSPSKASHHGLKVKLEEMEVDESNVRQGTSPLLTSLLKSPSPAPNPGSSILNTMGMAASQTRASAPTITNLLTGSLSTTSQKAITGVVPSADGASPAPTVYPHQLTQPLTGPPTGDSAANNVMQSPSQSAPTLSMLLENKNRESGQHRTLSQSRYDVQQSKADTTAQDMDLSKSFASDLIASDANATDSPIKDEDQRELMDVFNELIPDDIADILNPELLEGDTILDNVDDIMAAEEALHEADDNKNFATDNATAELEVVNTFPASKNDNANEEATEELKLLKEEINETLSSENNNPDEGNIEITEEPTTLTTPSEQDAALPPKEDDSSSNGSNDTPLSELLKHKDNSMEADESADTRPTSEQPDAFESDSNDDKCLESIKREIQGLSGLKENNSSENSSEPPEEKVPETPAAIETVDEVTPDETNEESSTDTPIDIKEEIVDAPEPAPSEEVATSEPDAVKSDDVESPTEEADPKNDEVEIDVKMESQSSPAEEEVTEEVVEIKSDDNKSEEEKSEPTDTLEDDGNVKELPLEAKDEPEKLEEMEEEQEIENGDEEGDDNDADSKEPTSSSIADESSQPLPERKMSSDEEIFVDAKESMDDTNEEDGAMERQVVQQPNMIADTDDDLPMEVIKEYKTGRIKRDYSRRKLESTPSTEKRSDDPASGEEISSIGTRMKLKERDRSESPYCDDESNELVIKSKRRCSSTPIIDSLPNSPASSDDREYRGWKKSILIVYSRLITHKNASLFAKPISEDHAPDYRDIVLQPMDLQTLKRNIENGSIRTTLDFQRYVMVMCYNSIFYNFNDELTCAMAKEMLRDALALIDDIMELWRKENEKSASSSSSSATKIVGRGRKSNRFVT